MMGANRDFVYSSVEYTEKSVTVCLKCGLYKYCTGTLPTRLKLNYNPDKELLLLKFLWLYKAHRHSNQYMAEWSKVLDARRHVPNNKFHSEVLESYSSIIQSQSSFESSTRCVRMCATACSTVFIVQALHSVNIVYHSLLL